MIKGPAVLPTDAQSATQTIVFRACLPHEKLARNAAQRLLTQKRNLSFCLIPVNTSNFRPKGQKIAGIFFGEIDLNRLTSYTIGLSEFARSN
jgi:hypothetical protein